MAVSITGGVDPPLLLKLLADGQLHSGEWLAGRLGVSRTAVWKGVERLRARGIDIGAVPRRGYALGRAVELLEERQILAAISPACSARLHRLTLEFEVDSTNSRLLEAVPPPFGCADVSLSELQHAGRGRRGRTWTAPFGGSLVLSLAWSFADAARASPTLSLCAGVAVSRALIRAGAVGVGVKWPNDLWFADRKAGGVLIESRAESQGPAHVVIGVGLNVALSDGARGQLEAAGMSIATVAEACALAPSRNFIAGAIIDELLSMLMDYERQGFGALRDSWAVLDVLRDRPVEVLVGGTAVAGIARGINERGELCLERDGRVDSFASGEASLRLGAAEKTVQE